MPPNSAATAKTTELAEQRRLGGHRTRAAVAADDPLGGVQFERFRLAYLRVALAHNASAAEMATALGAATKTLDNWRKDPPRVSDLPFTAVVRMALLSQLPLAWFAGVGPVDGLPELDTTVRPAKAELDASQLEQLSRFLDRMVEQRHGAAAELEPKPRRRRQHTNGTAPAAPAKKKRRAGG